MPPVEPDTDVLTFLSAALVALGTVGGIAWTASGGSANMFRGPVRPASLTATGGIPTAAIFVLASGGIPMAPFIGPSAGSQSDARVQVRVRGNPDDNLNAQLVARTVRDILHKASITGYSLVLCQNAEPIYLAQDAAGAHEWSINFVLTRTGTP